MGTAIFESKKSCFYGVGCVLGGCFLPKSRMDWPRASVFFFSSGVGWTGVGFGTGLFSVGSGDTVGVGAGVDLFSLDTVGCGLGSLGELVAAGGVGWGV